MLVNYALESAVNEGRRKSGGNGVGWGNQFVFFADEANLLGKIISVAQKI